MEAPATALDRKRTREDEVSYYPDREESPEAKRLREDLLDILDDDDGAVDRNATAVGELDSVLRSLEEEIGLSSSPANTRDEEDQVSSAATQAWLAPGGYQQLQHSELGFLLEASDDELGLPPSGPSTSEEEGQQQHPEDETTSSVFFPSSGADSVEFGQIWGFEDDMPSPYEGFGYGYPSGAGEDGSIHGGSDAASGVLVSNGNIGVVVPDPEDVPFHGGLFDDFSDAGAPSDLLWRQETLPAAL